MTQLPSKLIFIVWAEDLSEAVAHSLYQLINSIWPNDVDVVFSPKIMPGKRWNIEVWNGLEQSDIGIICITAENMYSPWLLYEAGALSKNQTSRVVPLMIGIDAEDLPAPLKLFQAVNCTEEGIFNLVQSLTDALQEQNNIDGKYATQCSEYWKNNKDALSDIICRSRKKISDLHEAADDGEASAVLQAIKNIIPNLSYRLGSSRATLTQQEPEITGATADAIKITTGFSIQYNVEGPPSPMSRSLRRAQRLEGIRLSGGPSQTDWRRNPATEEYAIMKEAEADDVENPLQPGDNVRVERHVNDDYNGKVGTIVEPWRVPQHYWVQFENPDGSTNKKAFHVMYLTRNEWFNIAAS